MTDNPAEVDGWADNGYLPGHLPLEGSAPIVGEEARSLDAALVRQPPRRFDLGAQARHARQIGEQILPMGKRIWTSTCAIIADRPASMLNVRLRIQRALDPAVDLPSADLDDGLLV